MDILTPKQIVKSSFFPAGMMQLYKLIKFGEMKQEGKLPEGMNYLIATNIGTGTKKARWGVTKEEIDAWRKRGAKSNTPNSNAGDA